MYYLRAKAAILYPGNVLPAATAAQNHPGKVSLATTAALTSEKKLKYFLPSCCDLIKMYYLCTSNKSNNLNFLMLWD
jgi:hypothetical protein